MKRFVTYFLVRASLMYAVRFFFFETSALQSLANAITDGYGACRSSFRRVDSNSRPARRPYCPSGRHLSPLHARRIESDKGVASVQGPSKYFFIFFIVHYPLSFQRSGRTKVDRLFSQFRDRIQCLSHPVYQLTSGYYRRISMTSAVFPYKGWVRL